ncbi:MAG: rhodanese-related sulfurtransferase [Candidatus Saccharimonadales bacterium]
MQKIILFYKFYPLTEPQMTMRWQRELCLRLHLMGRVIIADHGINGTLGGEPRELKTYIKSMNQTIEFKDTAYKWSNGSREDFPRLSIKVRKELVTLAPSETFDVFDRGTPLSPEAWHDYLKKHPDVTVLDVRNDFESDIGAFKSSIKPQIKVFKEIKNEIKKLSKNKPVLTYCTGDIRCEYLSAYMKHKGFENVYHLDGGIVSYGERYGDDGFWEGKCYVFDRRMNLAFSRHSMDIGKCSRCSAKTSDYQNCANLSCNRLVLLCKDCFEQRSTCSGVCQQALVSTA